MNSLPFQTGFYCTQYLSHNYKNSIVTVYAASIHHIYKSQLYTIYQWHTQDFFLGWGGSTNSVEHSGHRERVNGGGSPLARSSAQFANSWTLYSYLVVKDVFSVKQGLRLSFVKTSEFRGGVEPPKPLPPSPVRHCYIPFTEVTFLKKFFERWNDDVWSQDCMGNKVVMGKKDKGYGINDL
jgi:hypothetical protein